MNKALSLLIFFLLLLSGCNSDQQEKLLIATAANMQFAMEELCEAFAAETGIACHPVISSSGKLTAQITAGAPYSVFVSADMKYPEKLAQEGFTLAPPQIYATGQLIFWSMNLDSITPSILTSENVKHIAIANPKTAPYGKAAIDYLKTHNLYNAVEHKLVYGESIAQVNQFVTTHSVDIGITALSVVSTPGQKRQGKWQKLATNGYQPIQQGIVLLKSEANTEKKAELFYAFLFSEKAQAILQAHGYLPSTK